VFSRFLQPAADGGLVARILVVEVALEELFFPWDHNQRDETGSGSEGYEQPKIIQPNCQSEQQQDERQIDWIATEPVGTGSHDRGGGLGSPHRGASRAKFSEREQEQECSAQSNKGPEQPESRHHEREWPSLVQRDSQQNRVQKYNRGSEQARKWFAIGLGIVAHSLA
jgi:hypothetical protein